MKKVYSLIIGLILLSLSQAFAQTNYGLNQSYFLTDSGQVHTVRSYKPLDGFVPLFSPNGFFILPEFIDIAKSSYILDKEDNLYTVDTNGYFYKYDFESEVGSKIKLAGESFFVTRDDSIYIILSNGTLKKISKDEYNIDSNIKVLGGNYFITRKNSIYFVNPFAGSIEKAAGEISRRKIEVVGDNYLVTKEGMLYAFGIKPDGAKVISTKTSFRYKNIKRIGGNFFFDANNKIHTISTDGTIHSGKNGKGEQVRASRAPVQLGANYFIYPDNTFFIVDQDGLVHELETFQSRIIFTTK